jgi:hypothetical protein
MKFHNYILFLCLTLLSTTLIAQDAKNEKFTSTIFKVYGACEQCKERIELALKIKGVRIGIWNVETKMLTLQYDSTVVSLEKIQNKIIAELGRSNVLEFTEQKFGGAWFVIHLRKE